jgi:hypothetical protein
MTCEDSYQWDKRISSLLGTDEGVPNPRSTHQSILPADIFLQDLVGVISKMRAQQDIAYRCILDFKLEFH